MVSSGFLLGLALLLVTPGPTNTLLAVAGATQPARAAVGLLIAELGAYLTAVSLFGALILWLGDGMDALRPWLQAGAALYLLRVAARMWHARPDLAGSGTVRPRQIATTTLLNPKTLIIALVLMPPGWSMQASVAGAHLLAMVALIPAAGAAWFIGGRGLAAAAGARLRRLIPRASALLLGLFAMALAGRAAAGW